jgi:hypothetical protein
VYKNILDNIKCIVYYNIKEKFMKNKSKLSIIAFIVIIGFITITCVNETTPEHTCDSGTWIITSEPTCTEAGTKELRCGKCNEVLDNDIIQLTEHDYNNWTTKTAATCTTAEVLKRTCSICLYEDTKAGVGALEHDYVWTTTTNPTNIKEGTQTEICSRDSSHNRGTRSISSLPITTSTEWINALTAIRSAANNQSYSLNVNGNIAVSGSTSSSFGVTSGTGKTVTLIGSGRLYLTSQGNLFNISAGHTLIINSSDLTLDGFSGNNAAVIELFGTATI